MRTACWLLVLCSTLAFADTQWVQGSTLLVRAEAAADARVVARLPLNAEVTVLGAEGEFSRVRLRTGREGWVATRMLGPAPLTRAEAVAMARAATTLEARRTWWQRAAALAPEDVSVREALAAVSSAAGGTAAAERRRAAIEVQRLRLFPVIDPTGEVRIEREPVTTGATPGVCEGSAPDAGPTPRYWVLPAHGAAIEAPVARLCVQLWNECGGETGREATLDARLAPGDVALVATDETPPPQWQLEQPAGPLDAATVAFHRARRHPRARWAFGSMRGGAVAAFATPVVGRELSSWKVEFLTWNGARVTSRFEVATLQAPTFLFARDVLGDAAPELIWSDGCSTRVTSLRGQILRETVVRCCGC